MTATSPAEDVFDPAVMVKCAVAAATEHYQQQVAHASALRGAAENAAKERYRQTAKTYGKRDAAADLFDTLATIHIEHAAALGRASVEYEQAVAAAHASGRILRVPDPDPDLFTTQGEVVAARDLYLHDIEQAVTEYHRRVAEAQAAYFAVPAHARRQGDADRRRGAVDAALSRALTAFQAASDAYTARQQRTRRHQSAGNG